MCASCLHFKRIMCFNANMTTMRLMGSAEAARKLGLSRGGLNRRIQVGALTPLGTIGPRGINVFDAEYIERQAEIEKAKYE